MIADAAPDAGGVPGYDGGRVITLVLTDSRDACTIGNVNCMGVNMPLILTGTPGVVSDVPTICVGMEPIPLGHSIPGSAPSGSAVRLATHFMCQGACMAAP